jgi:hypothetical protein
MLLSQPYLGEGTAAAMLLLLPVARAGREGCGEEDKGSVWFTFFLTSFSENLAMVRIWLCRESEYH